METAKIVVDDEQGYQVFKMNELDMVAAHSSQEAILWYNSYLNKQIESTINPISLDATLNYVDNPTSNIRSVTYRCLIQEAINEEIPFPCIIATYDW